MASLVHPARGCAVAASRTRSTRAAPGGATGLNPAQGPPIPLHAASIQRRTRPRRGSGTAQAAGSAGAGGGMGSEDAGGAGPIGRGGGGPEGASAAVQDLTDQLTSVEADKVRTLDALLASLTEAQQDEWYALAGAGAGAGWAEAEELERLEGFLEGRLDAAALRVLALGGPPLLGRLLSALTLAPGEVVARQLVLGASGEEVVLSWRLVLEEVLEPVYKGLRVRDRWSVESVKGEPCGALPSDASPEVPPEAVVGAQLGALADLDVQRCFNFASPANKAAIGDSVSRFAEMLQVPAYALLLGHSGHRLLRTKQMGARKFVAVCEVKGTQGGDPATGIYIWVLSLQAIEGRYHNCWMTDAVYRGDIASKFIQPGGA